MYNYLLGFGRIVREVHGRATLASKWYGELAPPLFLHTYREGGGSSKEQSSVEVILGLSRFTLLAGA